MRISLLLPHLKLSGGISVSMVFAHELSLRGHEVFVVVESRSITRYIRNLVTRHPLLPRGSKVKILRVREFKDLPDKGVFIADSWKVAKKLHEMKVSGAKFQYLQHDERMHHGDTQIVEEVYRLPLIKLVNASWIQRAFKKDFGEDVALLFNAIDCSLFNPDKRDRGANDGSIRIAVLHHDYAWKGTKDGVEIVEALKKKYPEKNIKLILFGTRQRHIDYECDEYHYNATGINLARLFANCDIYIGPSLDDSRAILHRWVMASGCAIAIYDNVSIDDYAVHGETALIARKGDVTDLLEKTEMLVVDEVLRKNIAKNAVEFVQTLPTWKELTDTLENIIEKAISAKNKKILITGAGGFVGSRLLPYLNQKGYNVEGINEEITDIEKLRPYFKNAEFVIHLAAKLHEGQTEKRPLDFFTVNVVGTMNVVKLCLEYGCKLINTSSITTNTEYGISKVLSEVMVKSYTKHQGLRAVTIRPCVIYDENSGRKYPYISKHHPLGMLVKDIENIIIHDNFRKYKVYKTGGLGQKLYFEKIELLKGKVKRKIKRLINHA